MEQFVAPQKTYAGYIFDCDGTLIDSMPLHLRAWNHGLQAAGAPFLLDGKAFMSVAGMALQQSVEHWNRTHNAHIDAAIVIREKNRYFEEHFSEITTIPAVVSFARECQRRGAALAVASGGSRKDVNESLKFVGIDELFSVVVTADDVAYAKPAPDLFLLAAQRIAVDPADCLVIEDSLLGIQAADLAGMDSVLVPHALH